jgi:hypothetical protein
MAWLKGVVITNILKDSIPEDDALYFFTVKIIGEARSRRNGM